MQAIIKEISSSNIYDLANWIPNELALVSIPLELTIGLPEDEGGDHFQLMVATPEAIRRRFGTTLGSCFFARHWFIVEDYNWHAILTEIMKCVAACEGDTWDEIVTRLSRYFTWEFEDYTPAPDNYDHLIGYDDTASDDAEPAIP